MNNNFEQFNHHKEYYAIDLSQHSTTVYEDSTFRDLLAATDVAVGAMATVDSTPIHTMPPILSNSFPVQSHYNSGHQPSQQSALPVSQPSIELDLPRPPSLPSWIREISPPPMPSSSSYGSS